MGMEVSWSNFCRCCLSSETEVSLLDTEQNLKDKFLEITTLKVNPDDGLPIKLCGECNAIMNSAYQFRKQCIKMDSELRMQLSLIAQKETNFNELDNEILTHNDSSDDNFANDPYKQLEALIKQEPNADTEDDCYYVLVIDDPKDKDQNEKQDNTPFNFKIENIKTEDNDMNILHAPGEEIQNTHFEESIDQFLISNTKISANVPATILENDEDSQENDMNGMIMDDSQDSTSQEQNSMQITDNAVDTYSGNITQDISRDSNNLIKILTSTDDRTILLKSSDAIQYLTDAQLTNNEDDEGLSQEVILCEGDESSQFQILKYEGSELVIEYADDDQITTVLQQEDGTFLCDCGAQFDDLSEYEKHQYKHNPAGDNLCNLCGKGFESPEILTGHMILHKVNGLLITCPFCNLLIKRTGLTQHIKYGHNNIKPQCNICFKTFANPNNLKRHLMIHSGIREFECDICFKRFSQKITMQTHRLTHTNTFSCNGCEKTFDSKTALANHKESGECSKSRVVKVKEELMKTVKQEVTTNMGKLLGYACSLCKKMFSVESALEQHVEMTHIIDPTEVLCSECGEVLPSKRDMQIHILSHKNLKSKNTRRFECSICGKGCSSHAMLVMHERVHTNERPFPCQLCALRFKTKTHLRTHQLTHTKEKKFGCSVCMKFFALKGNLVVHLRTHTGERPYVCSVCREAFIDSKYLKKHILKKHSGNNLSDSSEKLYDSSTIMGM